MDLLTGNVRRLYFKFLSAAFGSALISCIYGMVDMAMVGQYQKTVDINSGTGIVVIGLACLIIGETVLGRRTVYKGILAALVGSVVYRFIYAVVFYTKVVPVECLKLLTAIIVALAIAARNAVGLTAQPVTPCGACRQVALEVEDRYQQPMRVLLYGTEGVYVVGSMHDLVPLSFSDGAMR